MEVLLTILVRIQTTWYCFFRMIRDLTTFLSLFVLYTIHNLLIRSKTCLQLDKICFSWYSIEIRSLRIHSNINRATLYSIVQKSTFNKSFSQKAFQSILTYHNYSFHVIQCRQFQKINLSFLFHIETSYKKNEHCLITKES